MSIKWARACRIHALRWPSKDPGDYQTVGCLSRRPRTPRLARGRSLPVDRAGGARLPPLSKIVRVRREDAVVEVELLVLGAALEGSWRVLAPDAGSFAAPAPVDLGDGPTWSMTMALN